MGPLAVETFVILAILLALLFDFINGFHDSANAIATVVATRVLKPFQAVIMAGVFNFVGPFVFSLAIANAVGKGIIEKEIVTTSLVFAALAGAIVWDLVTWWVGLPTSSSHALVGGLVGATAVAVGWGGVLLPGSAELALWVDAAGFHVGTVWVTLLQGAIGGLVVGLAMIPWSLFRLHRRLLPLFILAGVVALGWFSVTHTEYPDLATFSDGPGAFLRAAAKPVLVNLVFLLLGGIAGTLLWAGSRQRLTLRDALIFVVPGACGYLAVATLLGDLALGGLTKVLVFMFVSPVLGFYMGFLFSAVVQWIARDVHGEKVNAVSRRLQLGSSAFYALTHGTNDAQKTMGVIGVLLFSVGAVGLKGDGSLAIPTWVVIASAAAMGLGTMFGGWRIVKTMAARITHLTPVQGFAAETGGGVVLVAMAESGIPVSTTHAISSSIMGVGATRRASAVRWAVGRQMFIAWILTIPASAAVAAVCYLALQLVA